LPVVTTIMPQPIRLLLVIHNHQPVGNFDHVIEAAYQDSYLPFLDVFESYDDLRIALHTSGSLMEWLDAQHPEYVDRLAALVATGRIEIVGGAFFEPILTMIPRRDRLGQVRLYTQWLEDRLGAKISGMWMPERVWEQPLTSDLADAGIRYTMLDDTHFKHAGLRQEELHGYYVSEDEGRVLSIFPGSEPMRYLVPFAEPQQSIDYLASVAGEYPGSIVVFADDGEKFGTWPETKQHVYDNGWLRRFFDALRDNSDWIHVTTPSEALEAVPPQGKIYLPEGSYREMTEWVLPTDRLLEYEEVKHELEHDPRWPRLAQFVRGGYWRNFKTKYPESNEMYARMMQVSARLQEAEAAGLGGEALEEARRELYRGQCNCSYWHGAFGGIYLPHLRNAVYRHLLRAEDLLLQAERRSEPWVADCAADFNFDLRQEVQLAGDKLSALFAPASGGMLYELDVRSIAHNLLATLARRPEAYHKKVLGGEQSHAEGAASIHDRVVFKQQGLDQRVQYDGHLRKSLIDHFYDPEVALADVAAGHAAERGDFVTGVYQATVGRNPDRIQVKLTRRGLAAGREIRITKGVTLEAGSSTLEIAYLLEDLPQDQPLHFGVEMNFAGLPSGADDRFFYRADHSRIDHLGAQLELTETESLGLSDQWLGIDLQLTLSRPSGIWTFPIETVSQSEGGFELVHQSVLVQPHWIVQPDQRGRWTVSMELSIDTNLAESRRAKTLEAAL